MDLINHFNRTSWYLDDILNINNPDFEKYISEIYPKELTLTKANTCDTHLSFLDLDLTVTNSGNVITNIHDKRDDFGFSIVNFPWLDSDVPMAPSYGIYISQSIRFAGITDFPFDNQ